MLTVGEALAMGVMQRARLIAGAGGLSREIRSVTVMDTPDISNWLRGGELLLSNVFVIRDDPEQQVRLVQDINARGAAALGIKIKRYVEALPPRMVELANALDLPLIEMPVDCAWIDVMTPLYTEIVERQAARLARAEEIHDAFTRAALEGRGLQGVTQLLSAIISRPVAVADCEGGLLAHSPQGSWHQAEGQPILASAMQPGPAETAYGQVQPVASFPIRAGQRLHGYIVVGAEAPLSASDQTAVEHAATVVALEMVKMEAVAEVERRFVNELLWDLVSGNVTSLDALEARMRHIGARLPPAYFVAVFDIDGFERYSLQVLQGDEQKAQDHREGFVRSIRSAASMYSPGSLCMDISDSVTVLIPASPGPVPGHVLRSVQVIKREVSRTKPEFSFSVGTSSTCRGPLELAASYREARQAVELGRQVKGPAHLTCFHELGSYRVLARVSQADPEVEGFCRELLRPLEEYERRHPGLMPTVETFFNCGCDPVRCAQKLFVHPNTVRYRLRKVETLCSISLSNPEDRFNLQLALKLQHLLRPGRG